MSTRIWLGGAQVVRQLNTITPTAANSQTYTITINGKSVNYLSDASATVAEITAGLVAAAQVSPEPEFQEITWADTGTTVTATGPDTGQPFTQTSSSTGGTLVTVATTAASGPNSWSVAANWSGATVPVSTDDVIFDSTSTTDVLHGLNQSAVTLASLTIAAGYAGNIGLPERNTAGYDEYRPTYLAISSTVVTIGNGQGQGSGRIKLDTGTNTTTATIFSTGSASEGVEAVLWKGVNVTNAVNVIAGSVGLAVLAGEAATIQTLRIGGGTTSAPRTRGGTGLTLTNLNQNGGEVELNSAVTTVTKAAGTLTIVGGTGVTVGTLNNDGGVTYWESTGVITTLNNSEGADFDCRRDPRAHTITNCNMYSDSAFYDSFATVTFTNPFLLVRCSIGDLRALDLGNNRTYAVT